MLNRLLLLLFLSLATPLWAQPLPPAAAIATAHPLATAAGFEILDAGGNAFDAAVAVSAVLAVVEPQSSGLGGGGFWLLHRAADGFEVMIDGRERAPLAAGRDLYLDADGKVVPGASLNGPLAAGIPGEPAALAHLSAHYGRLSLARGLAPAIRLARKGFPVGSTYNRLAGFRVDALRASDAAAATFLVDGEPPSPGFLLRQPDLAATLEAMAGQGAAGFYAGRVGRALVEGVRSAGGIWTMEDLRAYRVRERAPVTGSFHGFRITAAAPPSSGGIALVTMLNILSGVDLDGMDETDRDHLIVEAMRRAYRDRAVYLGDPGFVDIPVRRLTDPDYAAGLRAAIRLDRAMPSELLPGVDGQTRAQGRDTTHFSILDREGNRVAATLSINYPFGSCFVAPGTGVLLNDEMDDFAAAPGVANAYGLVGAEANAVGPGKRPLSSMTPTFVDDGDRLAILGTPGGSRIITMVLLATLEFAAGAGPREWVAKPRFHHQFLPDEVQWEPGALDKEVVTGLRARGHRLVELSRSYGNMQAILWDRGNGKVRAASDPRGEGQARVGSVTNEVNSEP